MAVIKVKISKEVLAEVQRLTERHLPVIPFEPIKGYSYPNTPLTTSSINKLTDIDLRSLLVAGQGKIYSQYICVAGKKDSNAEIIECKKRVVEFQDSQTLNPDRKLIFINKTIKRPVFKPSPNSIDLTDYFLNNKNLTKKIKYSNGCYYCKSSITDSAELCEDCNRYYMCSNCYRCLCDRSSSLVK